jgi:hypothetical protein
MQLQLACLLAPGCCFMLEPDEAAEHFNNWGIQAGNHCNHQNGCSVITMMGTPPCCTLPRQCRAMGHSGTNSTHPLLVTTGTVHWVSDAPPPIQVCVHVSEHYHMQGMPWGALQQQHHPQGLPHESPGGWLQRYTIRS